MRSVSCGQVGGVVSRELGSQVADVVFVSRRRALTCGLRLADRRNVVAKLHPPGTDRIRLGTVHAVQRHLWQDGFPCPEPLLGPTALHGSWVTAEALLDAGRAPDPLDAGDRRVMARTLAEIVQRCAPVWHLRALDAERVRELPADSLWPFQDGGWIADLGLRARQRRRAGTGRPVVGHGDWHVEHVRVENGCAVAVYDWDSVMRAPEPYLVGCALGGFTANWSLHTPPNVPAYEQALAFLAGYECARGAPFTETERATALAHWVEMTAYAAIVEPGRRHRDELVAHGEGVLGRA